MEEVTADIKMLGIDEWLDLCADLQLVDDEFTLREARLCFLWSRLRVADESNAAQRRAMCNLRFEDFIECMVRLATMKRVPTDQETQDGGYVDGGELVLELRKNHSFRAWCMARPQAWNTPLSQPIHRCVHHLMAIIIRTVEEPLLVMDEESRGRLTKKEVRNFQKVARVKGE
mmetsp:Transcript_10886/g.27892  ORF Transcript_10886/g.27892 Transcript_10886/m.27892 type:complete len:173 (+) Transcript_10886:722-1240(+)